MGDEWAWKWEVIDEGCEVGDEWAGSSGMGDERAERKGG